MRFIDLFHQNIEKKMESSSKNDLVNISNFYQCLVNWKVVEKQKTEKYFQSAFYRDFSEQWKLKKVFSIQNFFQILELFQIDFDIDLYQSLVEKLKNCFQFKQKNQENDVKQIFLQFCSSFKFFPQNKIFIQDEQFYQQFSNFYQNLKPSDKEQSFQCFNDFLTEKEQILKQFIILKENIQIKPRESKVAQYFNIIKNPQLNSNICQLQEKFSDIFNEIMFDQKGWEKLFYSVYDTIVFAFLVQLKFEIILAKIIECIIKSEMIENKSSQTGDSNISEKSRPQLEIEVLFDDNMNFSNSLIQIVMSKIEQQIKIFNQQFALFGLILRDSGERIIHYYSIFVIWRFICSKKWGILEKNKYMLQNNQKKQFEKFQAKITQDKQEQTKIKAESLINYMYQGFIDKFYLENREVAQEMLLKKQTSSSQLVQLLDEQLLQQNFPRPSIFFPNGNKLNDILNYITDQAQYIDAYVDRYIKQIQGDLESKFEKSLKLEVKNFLTDIKQNTQILQNSIKDQFVSIQDLFNVYNHKYEIFYEQKLFLIIFGCIQGENIDEINLLKGQYQKMFLSNNYRRLQKPIPMKYMNQSDQQVQLLQFFVEQVLEYIEIKIQNIGQLKFNLSNLLIQSKLDAIRLRMRGCQHSCPMCKRKCDQEVENHERHSCTNGHQLRGMNGVLIDATPSLYTCEEIEDDIMIATIENGQRRSWKEIKKIYSDWQFRSLLKNDVQANKYKMMKVWNDGLGRLLCESLQKQLYSASPCPNVEHRRHVVKYCVIQ